MKHCPSCGTSYTDNALTYCLTDGAVLVAAAAQPRAASLPTLSFPQQQAENSFRHATPPSWPPNAAAAPQWPAQPVAVAPPRKASPLPWIIGGGLLAIVGVAIGLILFLSGSKREAGGPVADTSNTTRATPQTPTPESKPSPAPDKTVLPDQQTAPIDPDEVLGQLTELENQWNEANMKGDRAAIVRILANEFRGVGGNGSVENKEQYLKSLAPNPTIKTLTLSDLKVSVTNGTAVLTGLNTAKFKRGGTWVFRFTDTFIWRDRRWQAISSQATRVK